MSRRAHFTWRKLSAAKWEDAWLERLATVRDRLAITALAGRKSIRLEAFQLTHAQAERLRQAFGGEVAAQKKERPLSEQPARPPIRVRGRLVVVATEREREEMRALSPSPPVLCIPAGMAFGTGDHATTATCLRLLADVSRALRGQPWEMLDLGTGTGILALGGRLLGAARVEAGDFDPAAVRVAKENLSLNAVTRVAMRRFDVRDWQPARTWEVVVANMFSGVLIEAAPKIAAATAAGGALIFSGVLRGQHAEAAAAFEGSGFSLERVVRKGKWVTTLARRLA